MVLMQFSLRFYNKLKVQELLTLFAYLRNKHFALKYCPREVTWQGGAIDLVQFIMN